MSTDQLLQKLEACFPVKILGTWEDVANLLAFTSQYNGHAWLFRGASNAAYSLTPKVGRNERKKRIPYSLEDEVAVLRGFQLRARAYVQALPQSELEWLALAQHHGTPTRLLDWTEGLLTALWFAGQTCTEYVKHAERRALYVRVEGQEEGSVDYEPYGQDEKLCVPVHRDGCIWCVWDIPSASVGDMKDPFSVQSVGVYRPAHFDRRISAQQSVFTLQPPTKPLTYSRLVKFVVTARFKFEMRKRLDAAGINQRSLFPDLAGLGEDLAWRYKNNWLAPHRERRADSQLPLVATPTEGGTVNPND